MTAMPPKTLILTRMPPRSFAMTAMPPCISTPLFSPAVPLFLYFEAVKLNIIASPIMLSINDLFLTIEEARDTINRHVLDEGESYKAYKSDSCRYIIICKKAACKFIIRASLLKKNGAIITVLSAYSCSLATYYKNKQLSSLWFLKDYHQASIVDNKTLIPAQIQSGRQLDRPNISK
jgi:hypothetical protein